MSFYSSMNHETESSAAVLVLLHQKLSFFIRPLMIIVQSRNDIFRKYHFYTISHEYPLKWKRVFIVVRAIESVIQILSQGNLRPRLKF